ncbi:MAG: ribbon-helix-helix protein, CopG family [Thermoleophilaceae bacterium]
MVRTTVYLDERDAAALRRLAAQTGRSQASIIREAVAEVTRPARQRTFRSHGAGRGSGEAVGRGAERILREELGRRRR